MGISSQPSHTPPEVSDLLRTKWEELPEDLHYPTQLLGQTVIACGATHHVMERCNFSCTCCYLSADANKTEPLPFSEVQEQLNLLREKEGPGGRVQITAGEVTLLPVEDLGRIIAYAHKIGLDPMVMTNGERFLDEPDYLLTLVRDYHLAKVSIHIDTTQRGRKGYGGNSTELELHAVRESFAQLIRSVRDTTGRPLHAASTYTVTNENLDDVAEVSRWFLKNADTFRIFSLQPVADVGRSRKAQAGVPVERDGLWTEINQACGHSLNRHPIHFGHPQCNNIIPLILIHVGKQYFCFESVRENNARDEEIVSLIIRQLGRRFDWDAPLQQNLPSLAKFLIKKPALLLQFISYGFYRIWSEKHRLADIVNSAFKARDWPRLNPFLFVVHNFMSAGELNTPLGKERLDACVFKLPVDGKLVSMCEMNATDLRAKLDQRQIKGSPKIKENPGASDSDGPSILSLNKAESEREKAPFFEKQQRP